jgi:hypothetical protein
MTGLWRSRKVVPLNTVTGASFIIQAARGGSLGRLEVYLNDGTISLGYTLPHHEHGLLNGYLFGRGDIREQGVPRQFEKFVGLNIPEDLES